MTQTSTPAPTGTATLNGPTVPQTTAPVVGTDVEVTATLNADGTTTLTLDAGTLAAVLTALTDRAYDLDALYRRTGTDYVGSAGRRLRTVGDAVAHARLDAGITYTTYDLD